MNTRQPRTDPATDTVNRSPGRLVTYLGTAPGVGKTYQMLTEGWRRAQAGDKVVAGWVERHGRPAIRDRALRLDVVPPRTVIHRGSVFEELDVASVRERRPDVVRLDELAHTSVDGRKRYDDVAALLDAGSPVVSGNQVFILGRTVDAYTVSSG